jgi:hypothetical protein
LQEFGTGEIPWGQWTEVSLAWAVKVAFEGPEVAQNAFAAGRPIPRPIWISRAQEAVAKWRSNAAKIDAEKLCEKKHDFIAKALTSTT